MLNESMLNEFMLHSGTRPSHGRWETDETTKVWHARENNTGDKNASF